MKLAALIVSLAATSACFAVDLATGLTVARIDYDLPALEKPTAPDSFAFRAFIRLALSSDGYAVQGSLTIPEVGEAGGVLTLVERTSREEKSRTFALTPSQARVVFGWFTDAKFLDPKIGEIVETAVLDGDEILIEGFFKGRYFCLRRNSGDSPVSAVFFRHIETFRVWKEEPNHTAEPASPNRGGSS
jgi:hypothetical protein